MSGNRWDQPGVPHKGWHCVDVVDLRADGESADETDYATCQMCGNEKIRYVHIMEHPDLNENFDVGCVCAEKMSGVAIEKTYPRPSAVPSDPLKIFA